MTVGINKPIAYHIKKNSKDPHELIGFDNAGNEIILLAHIDGPDSANHVRGMIHTGIKEGAFWMIDADDRWSIIRCDGFTQFRVQRSKGSILPLIILSLIAAVCGSYILFVVREILLKHGLL